MLKINQAPILVVHNKTFAKPEAVLTADENFRYRALESAPVLSRQLNENSNPTGCTTSAAEVMHLRPTFLLSIPESKVCWVLQSL